MNLLTRYAPPTFLKPVIVISTIYALEMKETAICFVKALNGNHALEKLFSESTDSKEVSNWIVIRKHGNRKADIDYHLGITDKFINGGTEEEWSVGYDDYLSLYNKYCPAEIKETNQLKGR